MPGEDDFDEDEDIDIDFTDEGSDFAVELDGRVTALWDDEPVLYEDPEPDENWGLSDGDSLSEGDLTTNADEVSAMIDGTSGFVVASTALSLCRSCMLRR